MPLEKMGVCARPTGQLLLHDQQRQVIQFFPHQRCQVEFDRLLRRSHPADEDTAFRSSPSSLSRA